MQAKNKLAVIALGGNALLRETQQGTIDEQETNTLDTLENIMYLVKENYNIVITHGNGPQIGNILMRNDAGEKMYNIAQMPIDICVADSQGGIGYMIERILLNTLRKHNLNRKVVTLITQILVDIDDAAFINPTKRIGKMYNKTQADLLANDKGWVFKEDSKAENGWRRVVASPKPIRVMNDDVIRQIALTGTIVIAVGGGGIPIYIDQNNDIRPAEAVIDKDLASANLAANINADELYILTDVPFVYANFKKANQQKLDFLNLADTYKYIAEGHFGEGSMVPKIKAAANFIENGGKMAIITEATKLADKNYGSKITKEYE